MDARITNDLHRLKPELARRFGVQRIGCFDCFIKHHHHQLCDVNVLVELEKPLGWQFFAMKEYIERKLEIHIDIFTQKSLKPELREEINAQTHFV